MFLHLEFWPALAFGVVMMSWFAFALVFGSFVRNKPPSAPDRKRERTSIIGIALQGVSREAQGGQRTTVDVLNSQQDLILAKARLIGALRERVIASYTLLSAIGKLDVKTLSLNTPDYLPEVHYHQVRDAWHGLRTPSGQ